MGRRPGRDGRPLEGEPEEVLFRAAFPDDPEAVWRAAQGDPLAPAEARRRWEAAVELARRVLAGPLPREAPFRGARDVFARYRYLIADEPVELFLVVLLDARHRPTKEVRVSRGILNGSLVHPREVFAPAIRERAAAVLAVHNHPSGDPAPSPEDRELTRRLRAAGEIVGIPLLDHVIIGERSFHSFREEGDW